MKKIGVLFGLENTFPGALVERINSKGARGVIAEFAQVGAVAMGRPSDYAVIVDRVSHEVPFYRAWLKQAALGGTVVINNPFWASADDKFFNYALAARLGVAVPPTAMLPHKKLPGAVTDGALRNLEYPLNWDAVFETVGFPAWIKPIDGGGWRDVSRVANREEFFAAYDRSGDRCMALQREVPFTEYFRCVVVGCDKVHIMAYDPRRPYGEQYPREPPVPNRRLFKRIKADALTLCKALGYDFNTVEFAVHNGTPYAIDFMNPAPEAEPQSVGAENFEWMIEAVAELTIQRAKSAPRAPVLKGEAFLKATTKTRQTRTRRTAPAR